MHNILDNCLKNNKNKIKHEMADNNKFVVYLYVLKIFCNMPICHIQQRNIFIFRSICRDIFNCIRRYFEFDRFLSVKISRNFKRSSTPYILSYSKIKYKHLFYKLESIFMNFHRFF